MLLFSQLGCFTPGLGAARGLASVAATGEGGGGTGAAAVLGGLE